MICVLTGIGFSELLRSRGSECDVNSISKMVSLMVYSIWISLSFAGLGLSRSSSVFSGVLTAEEVDGVGDKWSGDTTVVDVQTLLEAFLNMSL